MRASAILRPLACFAIRHFVCEFHEVLQKLVVGFSVKSEGTSPPEASRSTPSFGQGVRSRADIRASTIGFKPRSLKFEPVLRQWAPSVKDFGAREIDDEAASKGAALVQEKVMKLFDGKRTPNGRRARIFIREKQVPMPEIIDVDIAKKEHLRPEYARLNPKRRVPTLLLDDGTAIAESVAICRYFEEEHPEPPLFGTGAKGKAMVEMWNRRMELGLFLSVSMVFRHTNPFMADLEVPQIQDWGEANKERVAKELRELDAHLAKTPYICGEALTIADITAGVAVEFMRLPRIEMPPECTNVARWFEGLKARPSWVL
jgi:glutathione S-transferase